MLETDSTEALKRVRITRSSSKTKMVSQGIMNVLHTTVFCTNEF